MRERTLHFVKVKETKGTFKYDEVEQPGEPRVLRNIYVEKWFAQNADVVEVVVRIADKE